MNSSCRLRLLVLLLPTAMAASAGEPPHLLIEFTPGAGPPHLTTAPFSNQVHQLLWSSNLTTWTELGVAHERLDRYPDLDAADALGRFYRALVRPKAAIDDWKNQVWFNDDPFRSPQPTPWEPKPRWVKFAILLDDPHRVVFQDSAKYTFHYSFAVARLPEFRGLNRAEFDAVSLRTNGQQVVLGAVVFPGNTNYMEAGIQLVGRDPYPREQVAAWFETVRAMIAMPSEANVFYIPTFEQADVARANLDWFAAQGIQVAAADRWISADECYAPGWALGRLAWVPAGEIDAAYRDGRLQPPDILLTDAVPADVPPVAGLISLSPATPNSHVAILSQSFGIPFVYFAEPATRAEIQSWAGKEIMLRAMDLFGGCEATAAALAEELPAALRREILELGQPSLLDLTPKAAYGSFSVPADGLRPADIRFVGGKAANFGLLRRSISQNSPAPAMAFTFDLWDAYLDQPVGGGPTLREWIEARLSGFTSWPPTMADLQTALQAVRDQITDVADFTAEQKAMILAALQDARFTPERKIRFRSSTNVEDSEQFSGAGLYDSFSGCLLDDLDGDTQGPSHCDPTEPRERGVFRALRRVYASFYNDNAFLERLRHGVNEGEVGMAVLVHHSFPDEIEWANGVATLEISRQFRRSVQADLVTQLGAVSVANPDSTARPERVHVWSYDGGVQAPELQQASALVQLGATVLSWDRDYRELFSLLDRAAQAYEAEFPGKDRFLLDFEYKKIEPGKLEVKQIREVPLPSSATYPPYLLSTTNRLVVLQGGSGDLIAKHRLKSRWGLLTRHLKLAGAKLTHSPYAQVALELIDGANLIELAGAPSALPRYRFSTGQDAAYDQWELGEGADRRRFTLTTSLPTERTTQQGPLVLLRDARVQLKVNYTTPQPTIGYQPQFTLTSEESVELGVAGPPTAESLRQERHYRRGSLEVSTRFYWPPYPKGPTAGYTAPLQAWIETIITGLTTQPIVLRGDYSQTYHPGHHNFYEEFAFEPRLEPGLDASILAELAAQNIRAVIVAGPFGETDQVIIWGLGGEFRLF